MKSVFTWRREATHSLTLAGMIALPLLLAACGADEDPSLPVCDETLCTVDDRDDDGDGVQTTVVHAEDDDKPIYFSFAAPGQALSAEAIDAGAWDLSFAQTEIRVNGGVSGDGGVEVTWADDLGIEDADAAPSEGWVSDTDDDVAFAQDKGWYRYLLSKHIVEPRARLYYVRATDGVVYAMEMISYYDYSGEVRYPTFDWIALGSEG